jgi:hypothetical protein
MSREACLELARELAIPADAVLEAWAERAAIREYEGGQSREDAERDAVTDVREAFALLLGGRKGPRSAAAPTPATGAKRERG